MEAMSCARCIEYSNFRSDLLPAICWSARQGCLRCVQSILNETNANAADSVLGETGLHYAARRSFPDIVMELLRNKADVNLKNMYGMTPLHFCYVNLKIRPFNLCSRQIVQMLLDRGAQVDDLEYERVNGEIFVMASSRQNCMRGVITFIGIRDRTNAVISFRDTHTLIAKALWGMRFDSIWMEGQHSVKTVMNSL